MFQNEGEKLQGEFCIDESRVATFPENDPSFLQYKMPASQMALSVDKLCRGLECETRWIPRSIISLNRKDRPTRVI